jgi:hypothetical protein
MAKNRSSDEEKQIAILVIYYLLFELEIDFLALGEISDEDVQMLRSLKALHGLKIVSGVAKSGRVMFDTCFVYRPDKMQISKPVEIDTGKAERKFKIAQKIVLKTANNDWFQLFVSHWKSRRYCPENHSDRNLLGTRLREQADQLRSNSESQAYMVFMGDYNEEPFNAPLCTQLMATRDKALVMGNKTLLYNPFWQRLSYQNLDDLDYAGTYFDKRATDDTKWRTFDQIIVSSAFLGKTEWSLNETNTGIVNIPDYLTLVKEGKSIFDHLPVMATFERNTQ